MVKVPADSRPGHVSRPKPYAWLREEENEKKYLLADLKRRLAEKISYGFPVSRGTERIWLKHGFHWLVQLTGSRVLAIGRGEIAGLGGAGGGHKRRLEGFQFRQGCAAFGAAATLMLAH